MADLTVQQLRVSFSNIITANANSGISWGTNSYPSYANPGWFGGDTNGLGAYLPTHAALGLPGAPLSEGVRQALYNYAINYGRIRLMRILIYLEGTGYIYDGTALAHANPGYNPGFPQASADAMVAGQTTSLSVAEAFLWRLWNNYVAYARNSVVTLQANICHTSCHSNCHGSRTRR